LSVLQAFLNRFGPLFSGAVKGFIVDFPLAPTFFGPGPHLFPFLFAFFFGGKPF